MKTMVDLIEYLNQSGFTDLIRMFLIIGGLLSLVVFFLSIWFCRARAIERRGIFGESFPFGYESWKVVDRY